jgi:hypothetical protein
MRSWIRMRRVWLRSFLIACGAVAAASSAMVRPARACSFPGNETYYADPEAKATDASPPGAPVVTVQSIKRGKGIERDGCGASGSSCDDLGTILLQVSATDDQTETANLGYRIELASGSLPSGLTLPTTAVHPAISGTLLLVWIDGASDDQEAMSFVLSIRAVDLAGNEGPPTSVAVDDPGSGGCSMNGHSPADSPLAILAVLLVIAGLLRRGHQSKRPS